ncbi:LLM class F420-dependent oxidoreductase [Streptomyces abyssomicinicus]|uniref:LLM class F420-dependent oxidoreductase n=1 Tax=Streptomyces abyssomicinicus TaxID=574929 RepID=UPI001583F933|nr:LLM class F420-dependent oxidoreductase [Streptomyces abyssomicinicus]
MVDVGRFGIWSGKLREGGDEVVEAVNELDRLGFGAVWFGMGSVPAAGELLAASSRIAVATGILSIWQYDAEMVAQQAAAVEDRHPGRLLLGLGVSHAPLAKNYQKPYSAMVAYLDALDAASAPLPPGSRALAALGPKMLRLAAERTAGAHPYLVDAQFVARARETLGKEALLAPEVKVVLNSDPAEARRIARQTVDMYTRLPNYTDNWLRMGFEDKDFAGGGSDRLIDSVVIWGSDDTVRARLAEFHDAGADHVALQVLDGSPDRHPREGWRRLADLLELR